MTDFKHDKGGLRGVGLFLHWLRSIVVCWCWLAGLVGIGSQVLAEPQAAPAGLETRWLGSLFLANRVGVTGADGATSIPLPSGSSLWLFGDTVEGPFKSIRQLSLTGLRSNTAALVPRQDVSQGIPKFDFLTTPDGKRPRQVIPFAPEEDPAIHRVWGIHGTCVQGQIYLFYHRITLLEGVDVFINFQLDGMGIAKGSVSDLTFQRLTAPDGTREFWKPDQPTFGVFTEQSAGYCYLWGSLMTGMFLARVPTDRMEDLRAYEYLTVAPTRDLPHQLPQWSQQFAPTAPLFDGVPNEMSVSYNAHWKKYLAIHAWGREGKLVLRTAPALIGPWSHPIEFFQAPALAEGEFVYAAKEHPELARDMGRVIYVTFVNSGSYIPQLLEVTLP